MAAFNFFECFPGDLGDKVHDLDADAIKVYLTNATPSASLDSVKADLAEIATGNGYTGPVDISAAWSETGGTGTLTGSNVTITASGGAIAQFRYVVLFNDTPTVPADPLIGWWDNGSAVDLADGQSFDITLSGVNIVQVAIP